MGNFERNAFALATLIIGAAIAVRVITNAGGIAQITGALFSGVNDTARIIAG